MRVAASETGRVMGRSQRDRFPSQPALGDSSSVRPIVDADVPLCHRSKRKKRRGERGRADDTFTSNLIWKPLVRGRVPFRRLEFSLRVEGWSWGGSKDVTGAVPTHPIRPYEPGVPGVRSRRAACHPPVRPPGTGPMDGVQGVGGGRRVGCVFPRLGLARSSDAMSTVRRGTEVRVSVSQSVGHARLVARTPAPLGPRRMRCVRTARREVGVRVQTNRQRCCCVDLRVRVS